MGFLYEKMLNIMMQDKIQILEEEIMKARKFIGNEERKCKIYTNFLYINLLNRNIPIRKFNTSIDMNLPYEHEGLLMYDNDNYYLIDPTYKQFLGKEKMSSLNNEDSALFLNKGYLKVNNQMFNKYLFDVEQNMCKVDNISLEKVYFGEEKQNRI